MTIHKNANGKTTCGFDPDNRMIEVVYKKCRVLIIINEDFSFSVINYDEQGKETEQLHYSTS
jgi:hypothetical protein